MRVPLILTGLAALPGLCGQLRRGRGGGRPACGDEPQGGEEAAFLARKGWQGFVQEGIQPRAGCGHGRRANVKGGGGERCLPLCLLQDIRRSSLALLVPSHANPSPPAFGWGRCRGDQRCISICTRNGRYVVSESSACRTPRTRFLRADPPTLPPTAAWPSRTLQRQRPAALSSRSWSGRWARASSAKAT